MRVEDLVGDPRLRLVVRHEGDLTRGIRWVHTVEVSDPGPFLRGREVVLTTGAWRSTDDVATWVARVAGAGVVAVGFGLLHDGDEVPDGLVEAATEHGLTCFVVPVEVPFVQIVETFVDAQRTEWELPLRAQLAHHEALVSALRVERGVEAVLRVLARRLDVRVAVATDRRTYGEPPDPAYPVPIMGEGPQLLLDTPLEELDVDVQAAITGAMPFLALELERERALRATEQRYAREVVDWVEADVVAPATVRARLERLGVPTDGPLVAVVAAGVPPDLLTALTPALLVERDDDVVLLTTQDPEPTAVDGYVGVGAPVPVADLRLSLLQARHAVATLRGRGTPGWLTHADLASPTLLLGTEDPTLLRSVASALLAPAIAQDRERGSDLLASLRAFFDHGGRWHETAEALHVHINTLRHRLKRVEDLTGRSLGSTQDRVDLFLALRALDGALDDRTT